ncbi:hypothetical protein TIFTF001_018886 [Ficus carica]|uniref:Uncharacterized protein n=1 Tax=Ficus carica TaxID=3494 RepID=A0AA88AP38_FICCA|nr:hypothetical protein TIFTF001_018886 [Ficus carica]
MGSESESSFSMGLGQILGQVEVEFQSQGRVPGLSSGFRTRFEDFKAKDKRLGFQVSGIGSRSVSDFGTKGSRSSSGFGTKIGVKFRDGVEVRVRVKFWDESGWVSGNRIEIGVGFRNLTVTSKPNTIPYPETQNPTPSPF